MFAITVIAASLVGATAFVAPMRSGARSLSMVMDDRSVALPFDPRPVNLDGTLAGDVGFDPLGFTAQWADVSTVTCYEDVSQCLHSCIIIAIPESNVICT